MSDFIIYPAIDLRDGKVVRLIEGDPERQTQYSDDPSTVAKRWLDAGARWLHIVNLDGAFGKETKANQRAVSKIFSAADHYQVSLQLGGGLRSQQSVEQAMDAGADRVIVGTMAVERPDVVKLLVEQWGADSIGVGLDAKGGKAAIRGWLDCSEVSDFDFAINVAQNGVRWLVYTDISRDGKQTGLNLERTVLIAERSGLHVIASGGVSGWEDIRRAQKAKLKGVIVGRALYEGVFNPYDLFKDITPC